MDGELIAEIAALIRIKTPCRRLNMKYVNCLLGEVKAYFEECSFENSNQQSCKCDHYDD